MGGASVTVEERSVSRRRRAVSTTRKRVLAALRLSAWMLITLGAIAGFAILLFLHRGDPEGSARLANREIELELQRGETVEARVSVMQRYWWDLFRVTHGVIAATNRRLLYVGVPPDELLQREEEPRELYIASMPYDRPLDAVPTRVFFGTRLGVSLRGPTTTEHFGIASLDAGRLDSVLGVAARGRDLLRASQEAERRATEAAMAASRRAIYHLVQPGEALEYIASRYGASVDSLRRWNNLTGDRITAGKRLLVRPAQ